MWRFAPTAFYCQYRVAAMPRASTHETPNSAWSSSLRPTRRCSRLGSSAQNIAISPTETTRKGHASVVGGVPVMKSRTQVAQSACVAILANPSRDIQQSVAYEALPSGSFARTTGWWLWSRDVWAIIPLREIDLQLARGWPQRLARLSRPSLRPCPDICRN